MKRLLDTLTICPWYKKGKKCSYDKPCGEKLVKDDVAVCCSNMYYAMQLEAEVESLRNELMHYGATGICETCTSKALQESDKLTNDNKRLTQLIKNLQDIAIEGYLTGTQIGDEKALKEIQLKIEKELQNEL